MRCFLWLTMLFVAIVSLAFVGEAQSFGTWDSEKGLAEELEVTIAEFEESIALAIRGRSAHPDFIAALEDHLADFHNILMALKKQETAAETWGAFPGAARSLGIPDGLQYWFTFAPDTYDPVRHTIASKHGSTELVLTHEDIQWQPHDGIDGGMIVFPSTFHTGGDLAMDLSAFRAITAEFWFYLDEWGLLPRLIVPKEGANASRDQLRIILNRNNDSRIPNEALRVQVGGSSNMTGRETIALNRWIHIAMVQDGNSMTVYLDGEPVDLSPYPIPNTSDSFPITSKLFGIGADTDSSGSGRRLIGRIDEIKIWSIARTAEAIRADYEAVVR